MRLIRDVAAREPAAILAILSAAAGAVCALFGRPEYAPVLVAVGAAFLGLRTQVVPKGKAAETAVNAAFDAATATASGITEATAGRAGEITDDAARVVRDAVGLVSSLVGKGKP